MGECLKFIFVFLNSLSAWFSGWCLCKCILQVLYLYPGWFVSVILVELSTSCKFDDYCFLILCRKKNWKYFLFPYQWEITTNVDLSMFYIWFIYALDSACIKYSASTKLLCNIVDVWWTFIFKPIIESPHLNEFDRCLYYYWQERPLHHIFRKTIAFFFLGQV